MSRRLPPLQAVEAFLLAARLLSFSGAAERLGVSTSAFSRRIQQLEASVGVRLFERSPSGVRLTVHGAQYVAEIEPAIEAIRRATCELRRARDGAVLRVAASQSFASNWLTRRLPMIREAAGVHVELTQTRDLQLLRSGAVDCAIWGGLDDCAASEELFTAEAVAVAASQSHQSIARNGVASFAEQRLLSVEAPAHLWERWLDAAGYRERLPHVTQFDTLQHMYAAADAGLGVALAIPLVFEPHLHTGRLRACSTMRIPLATGYRIYYADPAVASRRCVVRFRDWLRDEAARSHQLFDRWWGTERKQCG